jgi:hypothetical protein
MAFTTPYAGRSGSIGEIMRRQREAQAEQILRSGDRQAQLVGNLSQMAGNTIGGILQYKADAPLRAQAAQDAALKRATSELDYEDKRQKVETGRKTSVQEAALEDLFKGDTPPTQQQIFGVVGPERGGKIWAGMSTLQDDAQKRYRSAQELIRDGMLGVENAPASQRAELYNVFRQSYLTRGFVQPEDLPESYDPQFAKMATGFGQAPAKVGTREVKINNPDGSTSIKVVEDKAGQDFTSAPDPNVVADNRRQDMTAAETRRHNLAMEAQARQSGASNGDPGPLESIIGPDGVAIRVPRKDAVGKPVPSGNQKPASGVERKALAFFNRAEQADKDLEALEPKIAEMGLAGQTRLGYAPNMLQSEEGQLYTQAQRAFTEARLRKDSGAAIPNSEFENDRKTYFVQPGDTKENIDQKRRARGAILASLGFESGQALGEFVGDAGEARTIVDRYKTRSARPDAAVKPVASHGPTVGERRSINGQLGEWDGKGWKAVK